ncbi:hypothetical protein B0T18DRAFT_486887 [Schizothecium vesticola]|uniref:Uncharacterized protein n=1 Tax=Schizothecium vesticola TaxID=314040 RepID=A0AA40F7G0_9PEZI|nr:hypothetical protein B0T18DRAFT_486887 [Schizothecium vesticola]
MDEPLPRRLEEVALATNELEEELKRAVAELETDEDDTDMVLALYQIAVLRCIANAPLASAFSNFYRRLNRINDEETKTTMIAWYWNVIEQYKTKDGADPVPAELKKFFVSLFVPLPQESNITPAADEAVDASSSGETPSVNMNVDSPSKADKTKPTKKRKTVALTDPVPPQTKTNVDENKETDVEEEDVEEKDNEEKDDDNPPAEAIGLNTRITEAQDLEPLRCQAWFDLKGLEVEFIKKKAKKTVRLTGTDASSITDAFFGPKWIGGCAERIIAIAQGSRDLDISTRAGQQAADLDNNMPDEFRLILRCLQTVKHNDFKDSTFALSRYLGLISFANAWDEIHDKLNADTSAADASKKRHDLLSFSFGKASYFGKSRSQFVREAKKKLCSLCKIKPGEFDRTKELTLLPLAIIEHFGPGGLLFLPSSRDPARQIWVRRSGLSSIFNSIKRSSSGQDGGDCLGVVAQRIKVEIIDRLDNGSFGWDPDTIETLSPDMPILTILNKLRDSRNPETEDTDRYEMESEVEVADSYQSGLGGDGMQE